MPAWRPPETPGGYPLGLRCAHVLRPRAGSKNRTRFRSSSARAPRRRCQREEDATLVVLGVNAHRPHVGMFQLRLFLHLARDRLPRRLAWLGLPPGSTKSFRPAVSPRPPAALPILHDRRGADESGGRFHADCTARAACVGLTSWLLRASALHGRRTGRRAQISRCSGWASKRAP